MKKIVSIIILICLFICFCTTCIATESNTDIPEMSLEDLISRMQARQAKVDIIKKNPGYIEGKEFAFEYVVDDEQATKVIDRYELNTIAAGNSELEKARKIMNKYSPMMKHESNLQNWDYTKENALDIYDYSIRDGNGINCKVKSKMFQECCLALGIKSRRVWMMPYDIEDSECHVIVEIFDKDYNKWIALDYTNNQYFSVNDLHSCSKT